ncbi:hypothetical protein Anapl_15306, partial [Anas platyrhynchos]
VQVVVRGLSPSQLVTLRAWLTDEHGERFQARAFYRADEAGGWLEAGEELGGSLLGVTPV